MVYKKRAEKRVSSYHPSRVCLIVLTSKLRLWMVVRMGGNVGGVVKFLHQDSAFWDIQSIDSPFFPVYSFWFSKHAGCIMYLDWGQIMGSMPNSWPSLLWQIRVARLTFSGVLVPKWLYGSMPWCVSYASGSHWRQPSINKDLLTWI